MSSVRAEILPSFKKSPQNRVSKGVSIVPPKSAIDDILDISIWATRPEFPVKSNKLQQAQKVKQID
jgi:hypothetical protein